LALQLAANAGHPTAQHYLANAHASGIWPVPAGNMLEQSPSMLATSSHGQQQQQQLLVEDLHVFDEWIPTAHADHPQVAKSFLLWHMAAQAGNVEAAMALAYRLDHGMDGGGKGRLSSASTGSCRDALPYYQAAADGIMDQLETSSQSRAKLVPPMDKHSLAQVHMHGGTSSQLDWNNKPDESKEALQFYHLKATTVPWSLSKSKKKIDKSTGDDSGGDEKGQKRKKKLEKKEKWERDSEKATGIDISAAFTLAHLYHHGVRGVKQNLTKSLDYYVIAGTNGHWESSGHACIFYLWGIGVDQDVNEALRFCNMGAPLSLEECRYRHDMIVSQSHRKNENGGGAESQVECDDNALNGLGLLHLLGIGNLLKVDVVAAEKYFQLAKELNNEDAAYNLGMMYLGWKTHFKNMLELKEDGVSVIGEGGSAVPIVGNVGGKKKSTNTERFALHLSKLGNNEVFKGPLQEDMAHAVKLLTFAANKGHVQAKHRLAMMYAEGITLQTSVLKYEAMKKDCAKAKGMFQWIVDNASPSRSKRLRRAYKEYIAGNLEVSLRNYLAAAETGSSVGQVNAAFLMERGVCLGMDAPSCAKASVRLWKVAAASGNPEACLRVGDFYYYGRLRGNKLPVGPFAWVQYFLYPERYLPILLRQWVSKFVASMQGENESEGTRRDDWNRLEPPVAQECDAESTSCKDAGHKHEEESTAIADADLTMAAQYYQLAVEKHQSARANFNLGFMHQWGLGLKQDFPLAKRHYDLAVGGGFTEAELAVQIALMAMNGHEAFIRLKVMLEDWWYKRETTITDDEPTETDSPPRMGNPPSGAVPSPSKATAKKTREEIVMSHIFNWSSIVIIVLVVVVIQIMVMMKGRQHQR
jgi:TPR repeat protein